MLQSESRQWRYPLQKYALHQSPTEEVNHDSNEGTQEMNSERQLFVHIERKIAFLICYMFLIIKPVLNPA